MKHISYEDINVIKTLTGFRAELKEDPIWSCSAKTEVMAKERLRKSVRENWRG